MSNRNASDFVANHTRTVTSFAPTGEKFRNVETGRIMDAGVISFAECEHTYTWRPWGLRDAEPVPSAGQRVLCAGCLEASLEAARAAAQVVECAACQDQHTAPPCGPNADLDYARGI